MLGKLTETHTTVCTTRGLEGQNTLIYQEYFIINISVQRKKIEINYVIYFQNVRQ